MTVDYLEYIKLLKMAEKNYLDIRGDLLERISFLVNHLTASRLSKVTKISHNLLLRIGNKVYSNVTDKTIEKFFVAMKDN